MYSCPWKLENNFHVRNQFFWLIIYFILNVLLQENPSNYMVEMARVESVSLSSKHHKNLLLLVYIEENHIFHYGFVGFMKL